MDRHKNRPYFFSSSSSSSFAVARVFFRIAYWHLLFFLFCVRVCVCVCHQPGVRDGFSLARRHSMSDVAPGEVENPFRWAAKIAHLPRRFRRDIAVFHSGNEPIGAFDLWFVCLFVSLFVFAVTVARFSFGFVVGVSTWFHLFTSALFPFSNRISFRATTTLDSVPSESRFANRQVDGNRFRC